MNEQTIENIETKPKRDPRALNAYRHGLTGQIVITTPADQVAFDRHCQGIHTSLAPVGALETGLAQSVAEDRWRLNRAAAIENTLFAYGVSQAADLAHHPEVDAAFAQAQAWLANGKQISLITLYEGRIQRRIEKNLALLRQMQQDRQAALQQAAEQSQLLAKLAASKGETYDPERDLPKEFLPPQFDFSISQITRLAAHNQLLAEAKKLFDAPRNSHRKAA